jgi:NNP family nitrate/nitrite transporter-like MFS transporter
MLMYGVVWVSLIWMYFSEVRKTPVMGLTTPEKSRVPAFLPSEGE